MTKRTEKICSWVYAVLVLLCVIFFRPIERLLLIYGGTGGSAEETLTLVFTIVCAIVLIVTGRKKDIGVSIALSIANFFLVGLIFYGTAWIFRHILP